MREMKVTKNEEMTAIKVKTEEEMEEEEDVVKAIIIFQ